MWPRSKCQGQSGRGWRWSVEVEGTGGTSSGLFHDVKVDHGGFDVCVPHEGPNRADIGAGFEQMRREGMSHRVAGGQLVLQRLSDVVLEMHALPGGRGLHLAKQRIGEFNGASPCITQANNKRTHTHETEEKRAICCHGRRWRNGRDSNPR
jgi:hypothetical protein